MQKLIVLIVLSAVGLVWNVITPGFAQSPAPSDTPTFYRFTPGVYVNPWPRLTITYPKDWVERRPNLNETFRVSAPGPVPYPEFVYTPWYGGEALPLEKMAGAVVGFFKQIAQDVTITSDKPSRLRDGTPAREFELHMLLNGAPFDTMGLAAKKGDLLINMAVGSVNGKIGEDLKAILYSIEFQPEKDKPMEVPADVRAFLDKVDDDIVSHDVAKVMSHYSDRFLNSGVRKGEVERYWRQFIHYWISARRVVTGFFPEGGRAYLSGFAISNVGTFPITWPISDSIIKEDGEWKFYGNQRNVAQ
jgi:hypothetical protein